MMIKDNYSAYRTESKTRTGYDIFKNNIKVFSVYFRDETQPDKIPYLYKYDNISDITVNMLLKYSLNQEDTGLTDAFILSCLLLNKKETENIYFRFPDYLNCKYVSKNTDDYFDAIEPNKQQFLEFLNLQDKTEGMAIVPVTVKYHYSTLFIDLKDKKMLCLFDSGLLHTTSEQIGECQRTKIDKILASSSLEEIEKLTKEEIKLTEIIQVDNPQAREYVFGKNLAKDIRCLNDYCLQDEQSCGYWTVAACELGASEEYGTLDRIQEDCESGIFQIKLAKMVLEITDDIKKGGKQNIILINPSTASFNKQDYIEYTKDSYTIFIKNIETSTVIGVDLNLLQRQMLSKGFIKCQQKADIIQQQAISSNLTDSIVELSNFTIKETSLSKNYPSQ